jgi:hypothetical protein
MTTSEFGSDTYSSSAAEGTEWTDPRDGPDAEQVLWGAAFVLRALHQPMAGFATALH